MPHKLPNNLRLEILKNWETSGLQTSWNYNLVLSLHPKTIIFFNTRKKIRTKQKLNFSRSDLFHLSLSLFQTFYPWLWVLNPHGVLFSHKVYWILIESWVPIGLWVLGPLRVLGSVFPVCRFYEKWYLMLILTVYIKIEMIFD